MVLTLYKGKMLVRSYSETAVHSVNHVKKERWGIGSIFLTTGTVFWSSWFLLQASIGRTYPCQYSSTAFLSFFSAIQSAIISLITERDFTRWVLKEKLELITVAYIVSIGLFAMFSNSWFHDLSPRLFHCIGNGGIWIVLCGNVLVCETKGSTFHFSFHTLGANICSHFGFLCSTWTNLPWKVYPYLPLFC